MVFFIEIGDECRTSEIGSEYRGKRDRTRDGIPCQRWDTITPHRPDPKISFSGSTLSAQENFCRNPNSKSNLGPWCYTVDPNVRWEMCDIPFCSGKNNKLYLFCFQTFLHLSKHIYKYIFFKRNLHLTHYYVYFIGYVCDFFKGNCTVNQLNDETMKWVLNEIEGNMLNPYL